MIFKKLVLATAVMSAFCAHAEEPAADPLVLNAGVVSEYRYRGISQSAVKPALHVRVANRHVLLRAAQAARRRHQAMAHWYAGGRCVRI